MRPVVAIGFRNLTIRGMASAGPKDAGSPAPSAQLTRSIGRAHVCWSPRASQEFVLLSSDPASTARVFSADRELASVALGAGPTCWGWAPPATAPDGHILAVGGTHGRVSLLRFRKDDVSVLAEVGPAVPASAGAAPPRFSCTALSVGPDGLLAAAVDKLKGCGFFLFDLNMLKDAVLSPAVHSASPRAAGTTVRAAREGRPPRPAAPRAPPRVQATQISSTPAITVDRFFAPGEPVGALGARPC
jgi:hypothetical protein